MIKAKKPDHRKHRFAIASQLLGDVRQLAWSNLGYWKNTSDYVAACQQLADRVAQAVHLHSADSVLDLGCGQGASLLHWVTHYEIEKLCGFEIQPACVTGIGQAIENGLLTPFACIYTALFDQLPLPDTTLYQAFDAVVCVDAAYHAKPADFLAVVQAALKPHGRLAFTTLIKSKHWHTAPAYLTYLTTWLLKGALIAPDNLLTQPEFIQLLQHNGFALTNIEVMNQAVLQGFAGYIQQQGNQPAVMNRQNRLNQCFSLALSPDWLKIRLTAKLCDFLYRYRLVDYVLISAQCIK